MAALATQDIETMKSLHATDYVVDWVYGDAFEDSPVSAAQSAAFFPVWLSLLMLFLFTLALFLASCKFHNMWRAKGL